MAGILTRVIEKDWTFLGDSTGTTNVGQAIEDAAIRNVDPTTGISVVYFEPGKYRVEHAWDIAALRAAGVSKLLLKGSGPYTTRFNCRVNQGCMQFDNSSYLSAPQTVSAISFQTFASYSNISRLTIANVETTFAKGDRFMIQSLDHPEYDATARWVGEAGRVKDIDSGNDYLWVDGRLEYQLDGLYANTIMAYKIDDTFSVEVDSIGFEPNTPTEGITTARTTSDYFLYFISMCDVKVKNCVFDDPWQKAVWFKNCVDCDIFCPPNGYVNGLNYPSYSQITYGVSFYGCCYNCNLIGGSSTGYRHISTTDGDNSSDYTTNGSSAAFTTVNGSATVTVNDTTDAGKLSPGDYVHFTGSTAGNNVTITGRYLVQTVPNANSFTITAGTTANASGSFGSSAAYSQYRFDKIFDYGQPVNCNAKDHLNDGGKGNPFDTHQEGANCGFFNCKAFNCHTSDGTGIIGAGFQIRSRRTTIQNCYVYNANIGINAKVGEHGSNNWLHIIDTRFVASNYGGESGRGLYVTNESSAPTNKTKIVLSDVFIDSYGTSIRAEVPCFIEGSYTSARPHRGHVTIDDGVIMNCWDVVWDSRSANIPGDSSPNRPLTAHLLSGTVTCRVAGMTHILGTDTAKHTVGKFDSTGVENDGIFTSNDDASGKTIKLTGYKEIDPSGIGQRRIIEYDQDANFVIEAIELTDPRTRVVTAAGAVTARLEDQTIIVNKSSGADTTVNLPASPYVGKRITIKDGKGDAFTNPITITPAAGNIDGGSTYIIIDPWASVTVEYNGTQWNVV